MYIVKISGMSYSEIFSSIFIDYCMFSIKYILSRNTKDLNLIISNKDIDIIWQMYNNENENLQLHL